MRKIAYGGDYTPEQWPREVWDADHAAFDQARIDTLTVGVFAWALTQPAPGTYDLSVLEEIVDRAHREGRRVCLGTGTAALPPWLATDHPEVNRTDFQGRVHGYGQRHNACHSSPVYREAAAALAGKVAERFGDHPAVIAWHVNNEYGGFDGGCWCERCGTEFRLWLRERYGDLDTLNHAWNTTFWSHRYTDWDQIAPPNMLTEHWRGPNHTAFQGITLDYQRFTTDNMLRTYREEKAAIREHSTLPVTTNFMGMFRHLDYHRWAEHLDFASWDNYPPDDRSASRMALTHDLMRGLKGGEPFWLMEQTPSTTASRDVNPVKRPGVMRLWTWQAVAHGADAALFFQMRQSRGACEKYHGAVLGHAGRTDTRVFREVARVGEELERVGDVLLGARTPARVAVLFDWDSWWALEMSDGPNRHVSYQQVQVAWHRALWQAGAQVDVLPVTADLTGYDVVLAPLLHMVKADLPHRLTAVAERGGTVVTSALSGRVDEHANAFLTDVPGPLRELLGIRIDEVDAQPPGVTNPVTLTVGDAAPVVSDGELVFELVIPDGAQVVGSYGADFYAGQAAVTRHRVGQGQAWFVGTLLDARGMDTVLRHVLERHGLLGSYAHVPGLELATRRTAAGTDVDLLLHHGTEPVTVAVHATGTDLLTGRQLTRGEPLRLDPTDVVVLRRD